MSATIKEVARRAGVSVATVSRVLNGKGPMRDETRTRILEVIEELRYVPHSAARSLTTNQTKTIGVLLPDIYGEFFSEVIRGIDRAAHGQGYHLLVSGSHSDRKEIVALLDAMHGRVDGLLVMNPDVRAAAFADRVSPTLPTVLLNCPPEESSFDSINIDNYGGAYAMTRHFLALGHRRIALIEGPADNYDARERLRGCLDAVAEGGAEDAPELRFAGDFSEEAGYRAGRQILAAAAPPTAIFAINDAMAIGCLFALREAGARVPEDFALAGFDDIPIARFVTPPLTSVSASVAELGERAVRRLLFAIAHKNTHDRQREQVTTTLVVRGSCGAACVGTSVAATTRGPEIEEEDKEP